MPRSKIAIYSRVSTEDQAEKGLSLEAQLNTCTQALLARGYEEPFRHFQDAGISAGTIAKRPGFTALLEEVKQRKVSVVIATKMDRLWRNTADALNTLEIFKKHGASVIILDLNVDTSTPMGEMVFTMMGAFSQFERKQTGERVKGVHRDRVLKGFYFGSCPIGYDWDSETKTFTVNDAESALVRRIYETYAAGQGAKGIATQLNREGRTTKRGNPWDRTTVQHVLRNPFYRGEVHYGRYAKSRSNWLKREPDWLQTKGNHPALIDPELWQAVRDRDAAKGRGRPSRTHLLSGLTFCGECQSSLVLRTSNRGASYGCSRVFRFGRAACPHAPMIKVALLEELVLPEVYRALEAVLKSAGKIKVQKTKKKEGRNRAWWEEDRRKNNFMFEHGGRTEEEWLEKERAIQAALLRLDRQETEGIVHPSMDILASQVALLRKEGIELKAKRSILESYLDRIVVSGATVEAHFAPYDWATWKEVVTIDRPYQGRRKIFAREVC